MGDDPDGPVIAQLGQESSKQVLKVTALLFHCCLGRLRQQSPHIPVSLETSRAMILFRAHISSRTHPHPACELTHRCEYSISYPTTRDHLSATSEPITIYSD